MAFAPTGYWYIIAYEAWASGAPSTIGTGNYSWKQFAYYDNKPLQTGQPEAVVFAAQYAHDAALNPAGSPKGAIRAYWWTGSGWILRPELNRDWGGLGLRDGAVIPAPETPLPSPPGFIGTPLDYKLPDASGKCPDGYKLQQGSGDIPTHCVWDLSPLVAPVSLGWLWLVPLGLGLFIFFDVAGPRIWKHR